MIPMDSHSDPNVQPLPASGLGDRIRNIANQLRQEGAIQIKATSRILGAAAKLSQNYDSLIDEVVEMVEEDLDQHPPPCLPQPYTVQQLQQQFRKLTDAKAHFGIKATSWQALVDKLNQPTDEKPAASQPASFPSPDLVLQRLETIEGEIQTLQQDMKQVLHLLNQLLDKLC